MFSIGIIGTGCRGIDCFGKLLLKHEDVSITALCDTNRVRMEAAAKKLGICPEFHTDTESLFRSTSLDAVVITTPDFCHEEHAIAALRAGVHVLIDKPLATTAAACKRIIDAAHANSKSVMMGFNLRHHPTLKRLKEIVDAGQLGRVYMILNNECYAGGKTYMSRWNRRYELSGGLWVHKGSHDFDVFNWLLGFPVPERVSAFAGNSTFVPERLPFDKTPGVEPGPTCRACAYRQKCPDFFDCGQPEWSDEAAACDNYHRDLCMYLSDKNVHDSGVAIVEYPNGVRASHVESFVTGKNDRTYVVMGDRAQAEVSLEERTIRIIPRWGGDVVTYHLPAPEGSHGGADPNLVESFLRALRGEGEQQHATLEQGLWSTAIGEAAEISSRERRMVTVAELLDGTRKS